MHRHAPLVPTLALVAGIWIGMMPPPSVAADANDPGNPATPADWPPPTDADPLPAAASSETPDWLREELTAGGLSRLTAASLLIVGAGALLVLLVRWNQAGRAGSRPPAATTPQLVGTLHLGAQVGLHLVQLDRHRALVGVDRSGLKSICLLPNDFGEWVDQELEPEAGQPQPPAAVETPRWGFRERLT